MKKIESIFKNEIRIDDNLIIIADKSSLENQQQTNEVFSEKWVKVDEDKGTQKIDNFQRKWFLELYGFKDENDLKAFLRSNEIVLDAGCGLGYKAAWFAELAPETLVVGMDYSEAIIPASKNYSDIKNLYFIRGDIADTKIQSNSIDYINCDQVIHHTENPEVTFKHLADITKCNGQFGCYVYAKKALPRELLDEHFREFSKKCSSDELWEMSKALTVLGKSLSELKLEIDVPDIDLLQIKGGKYDLQRFIYWNFMKCFWNEELGEKNSIATNYDWYAPSNATRYSEDEFKKWISDNHLKIEYFHSEEACYSGRFKKACVV